MSDYALVQALERMRLMQASLAVDFDVADLHLEAKVEGAYLVGPEGTDTLPTPCFMNLWRPETIRRMPNQQREDNYTILCQCLVGDAREKPGLWSIVAVALWEEFLTAFDRNLALGRDGVHQWEIGGTNEFQPIILDWNNTGYIGWEAEVALTIVQQSQFGLGET